MDIYKQFGILSSGKQLPPKKSSTHGVLLYNNQPITTCLPYPILQIKKKEFITKGYIKAKLTIVAQVL